MTIKRKLNTEELNTVKVLSKDISLKRSHYCSVDKNIIGVNEKLDVLNKIFNEVLGGFYYFGYFDESGDRFIVQGNYDYKGIRDEGAGFSGTVEFTIKELEK